MSRSRAGVSRGASGEDFDAGDVRLIPATAGLSGAVVGYFSLTGASSLTARQLLPDGGADLIFNLSPVHGEPDAGAVGVLTGAKTVLRRAAGAGSPAELPLLGVAFTPGAAFSFLGIPLHELRDRVVALDELWGRDAARLHDQLREATTLRRRADLLSLFLERRRAHALRTAPDDAVQAGVRMIRLRRGQLSIRDLVEATGIGERRLERLFRERVGLSPKEFARIARLHATLARIQRRLVPSWSELAADTGFADQAHMIREFRRLTGQTPVTYRPARALSDSFNTTNHQNH